MDSLVSSGFALRIASPNRGKNVTLEVSRDVPASSFAITAGGS
jgi:hypothetical protein